MLEANGYPFKSKLHSECVARYQRTGQVTGWVKNYIDGKLGNVHTLKRSRISCPEILKYQFTDECKLKISDKCCDILKKDTFKEYVKESGRRYRITGMLKSEGGRRRIAVGCVSSRRNVIAFNPLSPLPLEWIDWYVNQRQIELCELYYPPYNAERTGCKGCPFSLNLQKDLDMMEEFFPGEKKQCEIIWKPVYDEYRRLAYRLRNNYSLFDMSVE